MIVDATSHMGEHAWTKLLGGAGADSGDLDAADGAQHGLARLASAASSATTMAAASASVLDNETCPLTIEQHLNGPGDGVGALKRRSEPATAANNSNNNNGSSSGATSEENDLAAATAAAALGRKESLLGSFHRHLRRSLKAVSESPGPITRYRQTRFSSRRVRKRVIFKHGDCNVVQGNVAKRRRRYLQDIFTTLVDAQWRWTLLVFALSFLISWAFFGFIWWLIAFAHGDLEYIHLRDFDPPAIENVTHTMCVTEVRSLTSAFLYSIETQHTIGYGNRFVTEECPEAIFTMCLQCITGVFIQAFMVGIVFAKLSRPKKRAQTLLFSRNAVICHRDGVPCLMFRVGDMRKSHIIEAHVRAQIIRKKVTKEGEILPFYQQELTVGADGGEDRLMFIWPTTIVHKIDRNSPLYMLSASDMLKERFEVVCMLEGVVESTGMTTQARSSYLPTEILWGHRFVNVVSFRKDTGEYEVDYTLFNNTYDVETALCSSQQLDEIKAEYARNPKAGLDRALSSGLLQRITNVPSVDRLDPASDESLDSGRSAHGRSNSIPNGSLLAAELRPLTSHTSSSSNLHSHGSPTFLVGGMPLLCSSKSGAGGGSSTLQSINERNSQNSVSSNHLMLPTITTTSPNGNNNSLNSNNNFAGGGGAGGGGGGSATLKKNTRRLSIKADTLPIDSIC